MLEAGADVHARESASDTTALHWAAEAGHAPVARLLLDAGARLDPIDGWYGLSPLGWATVVDWAPAFRSDRPATVALLLERGAAIDLFCAIGRDGVAEVMVALRRDPAEIRRRLGPVLDRRTALHLAVDRDRPALVDCLLGHGAELAAPDASGLTALALAVTRHPAIGVRLRAAGAPEDAGCALVRNDIAALEARLPGTAPETRTALLFAAAARDAHQAIPALVAAGADLQISRPGLISERTTTLGPLHVAARDGRTAVVAALLDAGASPRGPTSVATPLHLAASGGHLPTVQALVDRGAPLDARDDLFGATPAGWAQHGGHTQVAAWLATRAAPG